MLDLYGRSLESDGMMSSVVMLSPAWRTTVASTVSGSLVFLGNGLMLGPIATSVLHLSQPVG